MTRAVGASSATRVEKEKKTRRGACFLWRMEREICLRGAIHPTRSQIKVRRVPRRSPTLLMCGA
eukprot:13797198-Heterocapsa_arctica.AAC.1